MICYLDTSALVKLYIEEDGSEVVKELVKNSKYVSSSVVAYAEARAVFKRLKDNRLINEEKYKQLVINLKQDWSNILVVQVTNATLNCVDKLTDLHRLRGFDLIHLASALVLDKGISNEKIIVACWDKRLQQAYQEEGFQLLP